MRLRQDGCRRAAPGRREDKEHQRLDCDITATAVTLIINHLYQPGGDAGACRAAVAVEVLVAAGQAISLTSGPGGPSHSF